MRVLIFGGSGMLGHKLSQLFRERFDTWATVRGHGAAYARYGIFERERTLGAIDAADFDTVVRAVASVRPDVVVNAIGIVKQLPEARDPILSLTINSLFPHRLASLCQAAGTRLIHVSTDCVFSGRKGGYVESDISDAEDLYGRTKFLGEVTGPGCLTIRTSIVGRELNSSNGLVEWLLGNRGRRVNGFTEAIFSGLTTNRLAHTLADIVANHSDLSGLYHVSSQPISKYDLLRLICDAYGAQIEIDPVPGPRCDRSLDSSTLRRAAGIVPASWPEMIQEMAEDPTPYDSWRVQSGS